MENSGPALSVSVPATEEIIAELVDDGVESDLVATSDGGPASWPFRFGGFLLAISRKDLWSLQHDFSAGVAGEYSDPSIDHVRVLT